MLKSTKKRDRERKLKKKKSYSNASLKAARMTNRESMDDVKKSLLK